MAYLKKGVQLYIAGPTIYGTRIVRDPPKITFNLTKKNLGPGTQSMDFARPCESQKEHQYNQGPGSQDPGKHSCTHNSD